LQEDNEQPVQGILASRDPLLITAVNEREVEHRARFTYAQERFTIPKLDVQGWKSDRGQILIRYGFPKHILKNRAEMESGDVYLPMLYWFYNDFEMVFSDDFMNGNYRFSEPDLLGTSSFKSRGPGSYSLHAENLANRNPDLFTLETAGGTPDLYYELLDMRDLQHRGNLDLVWAIKTEFPKDSLPGWDFRLFRTDSGRVDPLEFSRGLKIWQRDSLFYLFAGLQLADARDEAAKALRFEGYNRKTREYFLQKIPLNLKSLRPDSLIISDMRLSFYHPSGKETPTPLHRFHPWERMSVRFNLSNLTYRGSPDDIVIASYRILWIEPPRTIWKQIGDLFSQDDESKPRLELSNEYQVRSEKEQVQMIFDMRTLPPGHYEFSVKIKEPASDRRSIRKTKLEIQ